MEVLSMRNIKVFFSALTVAFAILGLTKALNFDITMPLTFVCLAITLMITAKEHKDNKQKRSAGYFLLLAILLLIVTAYNTISTLWGI